MSADTSQSDSSDTVLQAERSLEIDDRPGMTRTDYFFSYSGAIVVAEPLPTLVADLPKNRIEIRAARLGHPSFRATPQFTNASFQEWFGGPPIFPVQMAAFGGVPGEEGATINYWEGPSDSLAAEAPQLPLDTLVVTAIGAGSGTLAHTIDSEILRSFLEWLRALTDQWWIGRSYELVSGPLHFVAPLDDEGRVIGRPTTVVALTTASPRMRPVTAEIWIEAGHRAAQREPAADRALSTDAKFMFVSKEFRSAAVLACCAFEAARDRILERSGTRLSELKCPPIDLLKHLTKGFGTVFGRDLKNEDPALAESLKAFWIARGDAAHGKPITWRKGAVVRPLELLETAEFTDELDRILQWLNGVEAAIASSD